METRWTKKKENPSFDYFNIQISASLIKASNPKYGLDWFSIGSHGSASVNNNNIKCVTPSLAGFKATIKTQKVFDVWAKSIRSPAKRPTLDWRDSKGQRACPTTSSPSCSSVDIWIGEETIGYKKTTVDIKKTDSPFTLDCSHRKNKQTKQSL